MAEQATVATTASGYPIPDDLGRFEPLRTFMRRFFRVRLVRPAMFILVVFVLIAVFVDLFPIPEFQEQATDENGLYISWQSPNADHPFGTDKIGRDTFSRVLNATRIALAVGFGASLFGAAFGLPIGIAAGYSRGAVDEVLMRVMDAVLAFPGLILALALVSVLGRDIINIIIAVGIANIPWVARIARSMALSVREQDYVLAGRTIGASNLRIMMRYVLPNSFQPVIVQVSLGAGFAIIAEAGLVFPRTRHSPARANLGRPGLRGAAGDHHRDRMVALGLPRGMYRAVGLESQHHRRRLARRARSQAPRRARRRLTGCFLGFWAGELRPA